MQSKRISRTIGVALALTGIVAVQPCPAQHVRATTADLMPDIQKLGRTPGALSMVWWLPPEFWTVSAASDPAMTDEVALELADLFRKHVFIGVVDAEMSPLGIPEYRPPDVTRERLRLVDGNGTVYEPLTAAEIDPKASAFLQMFQPVLSSTIGKVGENMRFFAFPSQDAAGRMIASATEPGTFTVILGDEEYRWRLPLDSLVPRKECPTDGEELKASWNFCPIHGDRLSPNVASRNKD